MRSYCWSNFGFRKVIQISAGLIWAQLIENLKISPRKSCISNFTPTPQTIGTSLAPLSFFGFHNESAYIPRSPKHRYPWERRRHFSPPGFLLSGWLCLRQLPFEVWRGCSAKCFGIEGFRFIKLKMSNVFAFTKLSHP